MEAKKWPKQHENGCLFTTLVGWRSRRTLLFYVMQNLLRTDEWWMRQRRENTVLVQSCGCRHGREHDPLWWRMEARHVGTCSLWYLAPHGWIIGLPRSAKKLLPPWQQPDGTSRWGWVDADQYVHLASSFLSLFSPSSIWICVCMCVCRERKRVKIRQGGVGGLGGNGWSCAPQTVTAGLRGGGDSRWISGIYSPCWRRYRSCRRFFSYFIYFFVFFALPLLFHSFISFQVSVEAKRVSILFQKVFILFLIFFFVWRGNLTAVALVCKSLNIRWFIDFQCL